MNRARTEPVSIAVFARAPVPGKAKTRLIPSLGAEGAARLQQAFTLRALRTAHDAGLGPISLWCAPDRGHPLFRRCGREQGVALHAQTGADLGERMFDAFSILCARGPALLIGTDCPALTPRLLAEAAETLRSGRDAVFLPAEDGGYVLAGLRRAEARLFEAMPWGSPRVMAITRERLLDAGLRWEEPARTWDVDTPADLRRLRDSGLMAACLGEAGVAALAGNETAPP